MVLRNRTLTFDALRVIGRSCYAVGLFCRRMRAWWANLLPASVGVTPATVQKVSASEASIARIRALKRASEGGCGQRRR